MKFPFLMVSRVVLMFVFFTPLVEAKTPEEVFVQGSPSIVVVDMLNEQSESIGLGSGAVIGEGQVITNCHVAREAKKLQVRQSGKTFKATLRYADPERDLCQLSASELHAPPVALGATKKLRVGQRVYAIGAPKGLELTLTEGLISSLRDYEGSQYIQTSAAISPGSSGGGLFDDQGQLIGITSFQFIEGQNLNFALPVDWISELPKRAQTATKPARENNLDWFNKALAFEQKKDWQALLKFSLLWTEKAQLNAIAWGWLGEAYYYLHQYDKSIHALNEALRLAPNASKIWNNLGSNYNQLNKYGLAVQALQESLKIQPEYADAWNNLGVAYMGILDYEKAIYALKESLRIQPDNAETWYNLGVSFNGIKQNDKAIQAYLQAVAIKPESADAWNNLGVSYHLNGQRSEAREVYLMLRKLDPEKAERYFKAVILP